MMITRGNSTRTVGTVLFWLRQQVPMPWVNDVDVIGSEIQLCDQKIATVNWFTMHRGKEEFNLPYFEFHRKEYEHLNANQTTFWMSHQLNDFLANN